MKAKDRWTAAALAALCLAAAGCGTQSGSEERQEEKEDIVLTVLVQRAESNAAGTWEGEAAEKLYEDTGIRVEFYSNGSGDEKNLKQYLAAGTLPDLVGFRDLESAELLLGADVLLPLDEYEEELPGIFENGQYDTAVKYYREVWGGEEEHLYFIAASVGERGEDEYYWMPMMQWNAYQKAGTPEISTLEDYLDAAEQMQEQKPTTPLGERVYGFSLCGSWEEKNMQQPASLSFLYGIDTGLVSPLMEISAEDGKIRAVTEDDSFYRRALLFYYEANQRGLLDPDSRTQTAENLKRKYAKGQILFSNFSWLTGDYAGDDEEAADGYTAVPAADMQIYKEADALVGCGWYYGINKNSDSPEAVCELLSWLYEPENVSLLYSGNSDPVFSMPALTRASLGESPKSSGTENRILEQEILDWRGMSLTESLNQNGQIQKGNAAVHMMDGLPDALQKKSDALQELITELSWDMIYAESQEAFESLWKQMTQESEAMGIKELKNYYEQSWKTAVEREISYGTSEK